MNTYLLRFFYPYFIDYKQKNEANKIMICPADSNQPLTIEMILIDMKDNFFRYFDIKIFLSSIYTIQIATASGNRLFEI